MSNCPDNNCHEETCNDNPCYDNTGCLNPTTFACITKPGNWPSLGVTDDMDGLQVMEKLSELSAGAYEDVKVKVSANDTTAGNLFAKIMSTPTVAATIQSPGSNEKLKLDVKISADTGNLIEARADGLFAMSTTAESFKVKVNSGTTEDYLANLIIKGTDPLGLVSLDIVVVSGKIRITPTINITALCQALKDVGCVCSSPSNLNAN